MMLLEKKKIAVILCLSHLVFNLAQAQLRPEKITTSDRNWICKKDIVSGEMNFSIFVKTMGDFCEKLTNRCSNAYQSSDTCFDLRFEAWYNKVSNTTPSPWAESERFIDSSYGFQKSNESHEGEKFNQIQSVANNFLNEVKASSSTRSLCCELYEDNEKCEKDFSKMSLKFGNSQRLNRIIKNDIILPYSDLINCKTQECVQSAVLSGALDYCAQKSDSLDLESRCEGSEDKFKNLVTSLGNSDLNNCLTTLESSIANSQSQIKRKIGTCPKYTYYKAYLSIASLTIFNDVFVQKRNICRNHFKNIHLKQIENISEQSVSELTSTLNNYTDIDLISDPLGTLISQCIFETNIRNNQSILNKLCIDKSSCEDE